MDAAKGFQSFASLASVQSPVPAFQVEFIGVACFSCIRSTPSSNRLGMGIRRVA